MSQLKRAIIKQRLILLAVLTGALVVFTSAVHAQEADYSDPIMDAARAAGLVTEVDETQTADGISVTLDWAYADTQRIKLSYHVETPEGTTAADWFSPYLSSKITDDKGAVFSYASSVVIPGDSPNKRTVILDFYTQALTPVEGSQDFTINNNYFDPTPESVNLTFEPQIGGFMVEEGMYSSDSSMVVGQEVPAVGPFTFNFTLPLYAPVILNPTAIIEAGGVTMTLEQVLVTPTKTVARICYTLPDTRDWFAEGVVNIGQNEGYLTGMALVGGKEAAMDAENRCHDMSFDVFYDGQPAALNINIDHITVSMSEGPDDWNKIKAELAKRDIQIEVIFSPEQHGLNIEVLNVPEGVDYDQAVIEARESLGDWLHGPWNFTVDLP